MHTNPFLNSRPSTLSVGTDSHAAGVESGLPRACMRDPENHRKVTSTSFQAWLHEGVVPDGRDCKELLLQCANLDEPALFIRLLADTGMDTVNLSFMALDTNATRCLAEVVRNNPPLKGLNLNGSSLARNGANAIIEAMQANTTLSELSLGFNHLAGLGEAQALGDMVRLNATLKKLDLSHAYLDTECVKAFAQGLAQNSTLTWLNLGGNQFSNEGARLLAAALQGNQTLAYLRLSHLALTGEGIAPLLALLSTTRSLTKLALEGNTSNPFQNRIKAALIQNRAMQEAPYLSGAAKGFCASLCVGLPADIGSLLIDELLRELPGGLVNAHSLPRVNQACANEARMAARRHATEKFAALKMASLQGAPHNSPEQQAGPTLDFAGKVQASQ
jgi:hypothetical protein